ncbi:hypothetical protein DITRI_Ditri10aG0043800 [Diplodiscus trichospermus]
MLRILGSDQDRKSQHLAMEDVDTATHSTHHLLFQDMAGDGNRFCDDYFLLNPEKASYFDLFALLFSSDLEKRRFIDCSGHQDKNFRRRWFIFISVLVQKLLLLGAKPMALLKNVLEMSLNLISCNGGFSMLLLNLITGKLVWPHKSSPAFRSLIGHLDTRVELDKNIKPGDKKYNASLSMMAAKFTYENEAFLRTSIIEHWKMKFLKFYNLWNDFQERYSTQAYMLQDTRANLIVVAFRGTAPFVAYDIQTDIDISWYELKDMGQGKVHSGFMKALGLQKNLGWPKEIQQGTDQPQFAYYTLRQNLRELLKENPAAKFILTGHSLGGALAILFAAVLISHDEEWLLGKLEGVYTFGQPRVGDHKFGEFMKEKLRKFNVKYFRYVYNQDLVPRVPFDDRTLFFKHFGTCLYFNSCYKGKVVSEAPNKNYFSLLWMLPKIMIAIWELIRGFILPYMKGPEYREGWFQTMLRIMGLLVPGTSAHLPQDYVNLTRLGNLPLDHKLPDLLHKHEPKRD